jgi:hypothetical protein
MKNTGIRSTNFAAIIDRESVLMLINQRQSATFGLDQPLPNRLPFSMKPFQPLSAIDQPGHESLITTLFWNAGE